MPQIGDNVYSISLSVRSPKFSLSWMKLVKKISMICTGMGGIIYHVSKFLITHIDEINSRLQIKNVFI